MFSATEGDPAQFYKVWLSYVPGATADDALATIMAAVD
jgi:hypothetical protein